MNKKQNVDKRLRSRYRAERRFIWYGRAAVAVGFLSLATLLVTIFSKGFSAFVSTEIYLEISPHGLVAMDESADKLDYRSILNRAIDKTYPFASNRRERLQLRKLFSRGAQFELRDYVTENHEVLNKGSNFPLWVRASSSVDQIHKGNAPIDVPESQRLLNDTQKIWYLKIKESDRLRSSMNWSFFTEGDSRYPELAGVGGAIVGSIYTLLICLCIAFPVAVSTAVYLEEFAPKNRWTEFIEVNINNLAAVPSIIFGLLGLAVILNVLGVPRGTAVAGGIVLALRTLPVIIISCRAALKAVPPSIRQGALAMGASPMQVVLHHVLPLALPGTLTGTIIGLAQALGETAPLLMIGMVAFIVDVPDTPLDSSTVLPVQIYLWAESAERGFAEKTSAAILVILSFLLLMNSCAVLLRNRFERRW